jgi:predicted metal-dependent phosphoesterase TrpH
MDLVTITDHDSINGCLEFLNQNPDASDFFVSEEMGCRFPDVDLKVHIGAYGITEEIHREIQPLRSNVFEAAAYLRSKGVFFAFNHPFFYYRGQVPLEYYLDVIADNFLGVEARNGTMLPEHNELVEALSSRWASAGRVCLGTTGGSDAHTLRGIATTYTEAPGTSVNEFLSSLHAGCARVGGLHGSTLREASEIYGVVTDYWSALVSGSRPELIGRTRAFGLAFSAVSLPFQFAPFVVAFRHKRAEARRIAALESCC